MRKKRAKIAVVIVLILLPLLTGWVYQKITAVPTEITMATGAPAGLFRPLSEDLAGKIEKKLKAEVHTVATDGSLENLFLLRTGKADFGLYQTGTLEIVSEHDPDFATKVGLLPQTLEDEAKSVAFVANLYLQPVHFIVLRDSGIESPADLEGKTVHLGLKKSGSYAMGLVLLQHFGLDEKSIDAKYLELPKVKEGFLDGTLDAAFVTAGVQAPIFPELFETGLCFMLSIPYAEALAAKYVFMSQYKIPAGLYRYRSPAAPATDIATVALGAQLLTRGDLHAGLVEEVTKIVLSENFLKKNRLTELIAKGRPFAQERPGFAIHKGALRVYNPAPRPLLDPDFVEATEGIRSFIASFLVAAFLGVRWLRQKKVKKKEEKLTGYVQSLIEIERRQMSLAARPAAGNVESLQNLLNEVTSLRLEALGGFSAHELTESRAVVCFMEMCHGLSNKIDAKISRQWLERRMRESSNAGYVEQSDA